MVRAKFPVLATVLLVFGITWLLNEMNFLSIKLPWLPVILIIIAIGMIWNRFKGR